MNDLAEDPNGALLMQLAHRLAAPLPAGEQPLHAPTTSLTPPEDALRANVTVDIDAAAAPFYTGGVFDPPLDAFWARMYPPLAARMRGYVRGVAAVEREIDRCIEAAHAAATPPAAAAELHAETIPLLIGLRSTAHGVLRFAVLWTLPLLPALQRALGVAAGDPAVAAVRENMHDAAPHTLGHTLGVRARALLAQWQRGDYTKDLHLEIAEHMRTTL